MNIRNILVAIWPRTKLKVFTIPIEHHIIQSHQLFHRFLLCKLYLVVCTFLKYCPKIKYFKISAYTLWEISKGQLLTVSNKKNPAKMRKKFPLFLYKALFTYNLKRVQECFYKLQPFFA